jgi:gamma-glutamylcyclotransferase (GGCT)/AIG2-like uncharacterized protein YtfP
MNTTKKNSTLKSSRPASKLFVYGTLRNSYGHKLYGLLKDNFELIGKAVIKGKLFDIGKYPGAVISRTDNNQIVGELYQAKKDSDSIEQALKKLDRYEGYDAQDSSSEYVRKRKFVRLKNGKKVLSWVYVYNRPVKNKHLIESGDYIHHISRKKGS